MKSSKRAQISALRQGLLDIISGPKYLAYCICGIALTFISVASTLAGSTQLNPFSAVTTICIAATALIVPCLMLLLRKTRDRKYMQGLAVLARIAYVLYWILLIIMLIGAGLLIVISMTSSTAWADFVSKENLSAGRMVYIGLTFAVTPVYLIFSKRLAQALSDAARILDAQVPETIRFRSAEKLALLTAISNVIVSVSAVISQGAWLYTVSAAQGFLLWLMLRDTASLTEPPQDH